MKKKILFIANEIQIGGATKSLVYMAKNMHKQYEPIILINKEGPLTKMCEKYNIKYFILNYEGFAVCEGITKLKKIAKKLLFPLLKLKYLFAIN